MPWARRTSTARPWNVAVCCEYTTATRDGWHYKNERYLRNERSLEAHRLGLVLVEHSAPR